VSPAGEPSDAELATAAAGGDERAYGVLVTRHKESLYRLLRRYVGDAEEAREAAQEAFIATWSVLDRYDPSRPFGAWLRTIAINKARDRGRRLALRRLVFGSATVDDARASTLRDPGVDSEAALIERERLSALDRAISQLPAKLKEPLLLTAFEGRSQKEAGEILGVSVKTVETRVYRARKILTEHLAAVGGRSA
jgi:RNA polymerase sigma factor (sigma-70 family)